MTLEQLYAKCDAIKPDENGCHIYPGYDKKEINGYRITVHRLILERKLGRPVRPGYQAIRNCCNTRCVNPEHLFEGTNADRINAQILIDPARFRNRLHRTHDAYRKLYNENPQFREQAQEAARIMRKALEQKRRDDPEFRARVQEHMRTVGKATQQKRRDDPEYNARFLKKATEAWKKKYVDSPEGRAKLSANGKRAMEIRWNRVPGAEAEVCPYHPDKPAFVYVLPTRIRGVNTNKSTEMNKLLRLLPQGIFCEQCYQQHREDIETATEVLETWHLTRRLERYVKEGKK